MRVLLDTHVVLWQLADARALSADAERTIARADEILLSVVSFVEIGVKASVGKLSFPVDLHDRVLTSGITILGLAPDHGLALAELPLHHRDPFDRLLVAQAQAERLTLVSADGRLEAYEVQLVRA